MADIFVSYARQDKARVAPIVAALERQGWSVWWDPAIVPGQQFDDRIAEEIDKASAVVVVWTPVSVSSRWVRGEAREAADRGILVPLRFDNARLPIDVRAMHTTDLDDWAGDSECASFQQILSALSGLVKSGAVSSRPAQRQRHASICVLPFVNMSGDPEQEYFSDGLSEELLNQLAQLRGLKVAARTSSFAFKGQNPDLKVVSEKLAVAHVLEGSVRKAGNRLRITAQLINCADGYHVWSNTFNRELDDVFQIQEDIARAVAEALKLAFGMGETTLAPGGTKNVDAYDLYLRAQDTYRQFGIDQSQRAIALYRRAIDLDSQFALAWAGLGIACFYVVLRAPDQTKTAFQEMNTAFVRTASLAPDSALAYSADGFRLMAHQDWLGAEAAYAAAVALGSTRTLSGLPGGSEYNLFLSNVGRFEEAVCQALSNRSLDPLSLAVSSTLQYTLDGAGRYDEGESEYQRSLDLTGDRTTSDYWALLRSWAHGDAAERIRERMQCHLASSRAFMPFYANFLDEGVEEPERALALIRAAFADPAYHDPSRLSILAHWAAHFGDPELALAAMRRAFVDLHGFAVGNIWFPAQKQTRRLPGFKTLVRDLGLEDYWRKSGNWADFARPLGDLDFEIIR